MDGRSDMWVVAATHGDGGMAGGGVGRRGVQ